MLPKFLLLAAFCAVSGANLIGKETCGKGQLYWCRNLMNAKRCNAVKHCIHSVWEYQILPKDNGDTCNTCKDMVSRARAQLTITTTQEEAKQVFEDSCKLIAEKIVIEECFKFVDDFTTELVETLASQMDPQVVCTVVGLCNSVLNDELPAEYKAFLTYQKLGGLATNGLQHCTAISELGCGRLRLIRKDRNKRLLVLGTTISLTSITCQLSAKMVAVYIASGINRAGFLTLANPNIIILCFNQDLEEAQKPDQRPISSLLPAISRKGEFNQLGLRSDEDMTGGWKEEGFGRKDTQLPRVIVDTDSPASKNIPDTAYVEELNNPILSHIIKKRSDHIFMDLFNCTICLYFVPLINGLWKENFTVEEIKEQFHSACHLAETLQKLCIEFVDQYTDTVISLQAKTTDPQDVCSALPVCGYTSQHKGASDDTPESTPKSLKTCYYCIGYMPVIDRMWKQNYTAEIIKHAVHVGCNAAPKSQEECNILVDHIDSVVLLLDKNVDVNDICTAISVCSPENDQQPDGESKNPEGHFSKNRSIKNDLNTITFILCLSLVHLIDKMWKEDHTAEEIEHGVRSTCNASPELRKDCNEFVDRYTDSVISLLARNMNLNNICSTVNSQQPKGGSAAVHVLSEKK